MPKRKISSEGQDYISNLPDFIIGHILSFLSTKDAVRTSVLSNRWIYMWTFVTKLDFCDERNPKNSFYTSYGRIKKFSNFVCRVLFHINIASIQKFNLSIGRDYDAYLISQWLSAVLNKGVKDINVFSFSRFNLSYPLFQSPSQEKLVLEMKEGCIIKVPTFACLPFLTVLNLKEITFTHYSSDKLTLKLPLLRSYSTTDCTWSGVKSVTFEAPLLEEVIMEDSYILPKSHAEIKFCASHLTKFHYHGYISSLSETILILVDGHIASADIKVYSFDETSVEETRVSLLKLLSLFTKTECLSLSFNSLQGFAQVEHQYLADNPAFGMLGHLQLGRVTGEVLLSFLLKSPCLKTLILRMEDSYAETQNFATVPDCFVSTLKVVKFDRSFGRECELSFAKFVMENARVLERIHFSFHWKLRSYKVKKAKEKLFLFNINSSTVVTEFSTYYD